MTSTSLLQKIAIGVTALFAVFKTKRAFDARRQANNEREYAELLRDEAYRQLNSVNEMYLQAEPHKAKEIADLLDVSIPDRQEELASAMRLYEQQGVLRELARIALNTNSLYLDTLRIHDRQTRRAV